jgi:hypothetical protein
MADGRLAPISTVRERGHAPPCPGANPDLRIGVPAATKRLKGAGGIARFKCWRAHLGTARAPDLWQGSFASPLAHKAPTLRDSRRRALGRRGPAAWVSSLAPAGFLPIAPTIGASSLGVGTVGVASLRNGTPSVAPAVEPRLRLPMSFPFAAAEASDGPQDCLPGCL